MYPPSAIPSRYLLPAENRDGPGPTIGRWKHNSYDIGCTVMMEFKVAGKGTSRQAIRVMIFTFRELHLSSTPSFISQHNGTTYAL